MATGSKPSEVATRLIVEGSLDAMAGRAAGPFPPEGGEALSAERRAALGRPHGGATLHYPAGEGGVFVDLQGAETTIWFTGADSGKALQQLEKALSKSYPKAVKQSDKPHPSLRGVRHRSYDVPLGDGRAAVLDIAYPASGGASGRFAARILGFAKGNETTH
jgi:hypothetical protein